MSKFTFAAAMVVGKAELTALHALHRKGSQMPGWRAMAMCPDFIGRIDKPGRIICVTGTNGKTTVCNLVEDFLRQRGSAPLDNSFGSNTRAGVASALLSGTSLFNKRRFDTAVFEVDERSSGRIYPYMTPDHLIITNLFRDSVYRNANTDYIASLIEKYVPDSTKLILNADDLISSRIKPGNKRVYFSVDRQEGEEEEDNIINDLRACPVCGAPMDFTFRRYHHIGRAHCTKCDFASPEPDYRAGQADPAAGTLEFTAKGEKLTLPLLNENIVNIYNEAAAAALFFEMGYSAKEIIDTFKKITITGTRYRSERVGNIELTSYMLKGKNPVAGSRVCDMVAHESGKKDIFFMLDDIYDVASSSENICWYYECDFAFLKDPSVRRIYIAGRRSGDIELRMLQDGIDASMITTGENETELLDKLDFSGIDKFLLIYELFKYDLSVDISGRIREMILEGKKNES